MVINTNLVALFLVWFPTHLILPNPPNYRSINGIHEGCQGFQFPVLYDLYHLRMWITTNCPFNKREFSLFLIQPHKNFPWSFSIWLSTSERIGNKERKQVGKFNRVLLIKVTLPPLDKYKCFHPVSLLSTTSKIGFYIVLSLKLAPIGSKPCLHFSTSTNYSISIYNLYNDLYSLTKIQPTLKGYQG